MDFKQFRYFVTVAEEGHVGRAAEKLHMAQPALSQQIRQLELQLGVDLFSREKRRLALTAAGNLFLGEARLALQQAEHAVRTVRRTERGEVGQVKLGYVDSAMLGEATRGMLHNFRQRFPDVDLALHGRNVADQLYEIDQGQLDAGVVRGPMPALSPRLRCRLLDRDPLTVCLPADHPLGRSPTVDPAELANEMFVMPIDPPGIGLAGQISRIGQEAGFVPRISQYAGQTTSMACLVASGFGVAILPASLQQLHLANVIYRPLSPTAISHLFLVSRTDERSAVVVAFLQNIGASIEKSEPAWKDDG